MSSFDALPDRVVEADPDLLAEAATSIANVLGTTGGIRWLSGEPLQRPRSVVIPLEARDSSGRSVTVYFKRSYPPPYEEERRLRWEATVRSGLTRAPELESRLAELVDGEGIGFSRALATDPATLSVVTTAVPGQPMGRVWRHLVTSDSRESAARLLRRCGRAARLIEECSPDRIEPEPGAEDPVGRRVARMRGKLQDSKLDRLRERMERLSAELSASPSPTVYSHGDFSTTNVLVDEGRIGLIDFTWPLRQRGFDLAHFAFRLEYDTAAPAWMTVPLIDALIEGFGDEQATERPGWKLVRLSKLLKVVEEGRRGGLGAGRARRALAEIESYL